MCLRRSMYDQYARLESGGPHPWDRIVVHPGVRLLIQPRVKVVQVSGARGRRYRENAGGWSRGAGLRTVFESLYGVAMRIRLKTIEAWRLAR